MTVLHQVLDHVVEASAVDFAAIAHAAAAELGPVLAPWLTLREYQLKALGREVYYFDSYKKKRAPVHLMFNAATGAGKTALMAWNIGYLLAKGYQNFVFLVNSTTIVEKTKRNFLDSSSRKYLFHPAKTFEVQEVSAFPNEALPGVAYIKFSTVQGLCSEMLTPRENSFDAESARRQKIVILGDEAHHFNSATKKKDAPIETLKNAKARLALEALQDPEANLDKVAKSLVSGWEKASRSWEESIGYLMGLNAENVLLEFTATLPQEAAVLAKYEDKLVFKYGLKEYRNDGFTKEIELARLGADTEADRFDRMACALLMSQYRRILFARPELKVNCTPVILFKSNSIADNEHNLATFTRLVQELQGDQLEQLVDKYAGTKIGGLMNNALAAAGGAHHMVAQLQQDFAVDRVRIVDSSNKKEDLSFLSQLDDRGNRIRAIFAVDMLNEGWDVLSLFDIVRLYETRSNVSDKATGKIKPGPQTVSEAQLVGRGARYFPFVAAAGQDAYLRKYDEDLENEFRLLETLFYYSSQDNKYVQELKVALTTEGLWDEPAQVTLKLKESFVDFVKRNRVKLWVNSVDASKSRISLVDLEPKSLRFNFLTGGGLLQLMVVTDDVSNAESSQSGSKVVAEKMCLSQFSLAVLMKAVKITHGARLPTLQALFSDVTGIADILKWLKRATVIVVKDAGRELAPRELVSMAQSVLMEGLARAEKKAKHLATQTFVARPLLELIQSSKVVRLGGDSKLASYSIGDDWFSHDKLVGTSEERSLVDAVREKLMDPGFLAQYSDAYLIRNEKDFSVFAPDGRAFQPDFILMFSDKASGDGKAFQLFIEPKGEHLVEHDQWKEDALLSFDHQEAQGDCVVYVLGLEFYQHSKGEKFWETAERRVAAVA